MPSAQLCCSMAVDCMSDGMGLARKEKKRLEAIICCDLLGAAMEVVGCTIVWLWAGK